MGKIRIAILGPGNIGSDLAERLLRDPDFEVVAIVGRNKQSNGLERFKNRIPHVVSDGLVSFQNDFDLVDGFLMRLQQKVRKKIGNLRKETISGLST